MWRANITGPSVAEFRAGCAAVWDLVEAIRPHVARQGVHLRRRRRLPDDGDAGDRRRGRRRARRARHALHPAQRAHPRRHLRAARRRTRPARRRAGRRRRPTASASASRRASTPARCRPARRCSPQALKTLRHVPVRRRQHRADDRVGSVLDREVERARHHQQPIAVRARRSATSRWSTTAPRSTGRPTPTASGILDAADLAVR